jgi:uncharacterized protein (DUF1697 family)
VKLTAREQKTLFEKAGFTGVSTVLATGNVIFDLPENPSNLTKLDFLPVKAFVKSDAELRQILVQNPFPSNPEKHCYVLISEDLGFAEIAVKFDRSAEDALKVVKGTVYWQVPVGMTLKTAFGKLLGKKHTQESFTSRNINTLERILEKRDFS